MWAVDGSLSKLVCSIIWISLISILPCFAQQSNLPDTPQPQTSAPASTEADRGWSKNHIFWVIPNYRADELSSKYAPLRPKQKLQVALSDSFDPSAFLVAGVFAGVNMAQRQYPSFGNGAEGFGKYYGGAFADQAIGNMMTEAVLPIMIHQDPRYFVMGSGGFWKRTGYAISREVVTRGDNGRNQFNTSEIAGNLVAAGISNAYYPAADRSLGNTMNKWGQQIALDAFFNITKEFWPDIRHKLLGQRGAPVHEAGNTRP